MTFDDSLAGAINNGRIALKDTALVLLCWRDAAQVVEFVRGLLPHAEFGEVVVVDNESTQPTFDALAEGLADFPEAKVLPLAENRGYGAAHNVALNAITSSSLVLLLNTDTTVDAISFQSMRHRLLDDDRLSAVGPVIYDYPASSLSQIQSAGGRLVPAKGTVKQIRSLGSRSRIDYLTFACCLLRTERVRQVGGFDERYFMYWEDVDLCTRLVSAGGMLGVALDARIWHESSGSRRRAGYHILTYGTWSAFLFARKRGGIWPAAVVLRGLLSAARRALLGRPTEGLALVRGLWLGRTSHVPAYTKLQVFRAGR